jgi:hypothetical protein
MDSEDYWKHSKKVSCAVICSVRIVKNMVFICSYNL